MSRDVPQSGARTIPHEFLAELDRAAHLPIMGPGVSQTASGTFILPPSFSERQEIGLFELAEDLEPGGQADAYQVVWNQSSGQYEVDTASGTTPVYDVLECFRALTGAWGFAWQGPDSSDNQIVYVQPMAQRCKAQLAANVAMGTGTTTVTVDNVYPMDEGMDPDPDNAGLTVRNRHRYRALDNAPCDIVWDEDADEWVLDWVRHQAMRIRGTLYAALTTTTASQTVSSPVAMDGGEVPSGTLTAYNEYTTKGMSGPSGGECIAMWNESSGHYEFIYIEGASQDVVIDVQVSGLDLQIKTRGLVGWWSGAASDWTTVTGWTGTECE